MSKERVLRVWLGNFARVWWWVFNVLYGSMEVLLYRLGDFKVGLC